MNMVNVKYVDIGVFTGSPQEIDNAGIKRLDECVVITKDHFNELSEKAWKYDDLEK